MNNARHLPLEEQLSAFADGELAPEALTQLLADLSREDTLRENWHAYHVVGDVLRSTDLAPSASEAAFWDRLEQRLANEPVRPLPAALLSHAVVHKGASANQHWAWLAGAACPLWPLRCLWACGSEMLRQRVLNWRVLRQLQWLQLSRPKPAM